MSELGRWAVYLMIFAAAGAAAHGALVLIRGRLTRHHHGYMNGMTDRLREMRSTLPAEHVHAYTVASAVGLPLVVFAFTQTWPLALLAAPLGYWVPQAVLAQMVRRRREAFEDQLPEAAELMANALMSGRSLPQACDVVATEMVDPIATEFEVVVRQIRLGRSATDALRVLNERMESEDLNILITSLLISIESGGDIGRELRVIAETIRKRRSVQQKIRVVTAEGRVQGVGMAVVPFILLTVLCVIDRPAMDPLFHGTGLYLLMGTGVWMGIGFVVIRKILNVDV